MTFTRTEDNPFEDTSVLAEDFIPDKVLGRDKELKEIEEIFQQIIDIEEPVNAFIYGISGTGKTVSVKHKQQDLKTSLESYEDVHATFVYQNCESLTSSYQAAIAIANTYLKDPEYDFLSEQLGLSGDLIPSSGLPKDRVYEMLFEVLDSLTYRNTDYRSQLEQALEQEQQQEGRFVNVTADSLVGLNDKSVDEKKEDVRAKLEEKYGIHSPEEVTNYVTVILDEVDRIGTRDELLYEVPRSRTNGRLTNVRPSIIGISNDIGYKESIQTKTDSSLRLKEITFKKYSSEQLEDILRQRAEMAFSKDVGVSFIKLAAAYASKEGGDARYGIDLLQKAGMKAKKQGDTKVMEEHLRIAQEEHERNRVEEVTADLGDHEKLVLAALMYHDLRDEVPIKRQKLYETYRNFADDLLESSNGSRAVAEYLKGMSQLGLLKRGESYGGPGDSGFTYQLEKVDYNLIIDVLKNTEPAGLTEPGLNLLPEQLVDSLANLNHTELRDSSVSFD